MSRSPEAPFPTQRMVGGEYVVDTLTGEVYATNNSTKPETPAKEQTDQPNHITGKNSLSLADYNL